MERGNHEDDRSVRRPERSVTPPGDDTPGPAARPDCQGTRLYFDPAAEQIVDTAPAA
jgi:hypothetical protein